MNIPAQSSTLTKTTRIDRSFRQTFIRSFKNQGVCGLVKVVLALALSVAFETSPVLAQAAGVGVRDYAVELAKVLLPRTIFVSSEVYTPNLGGLAGADYICQSLADSPTSIVSDGNYIALLSTSTANASGRLGAVSGPIVRPDGVPVAANLAALFAPSRIRLSDGSYQTVHARDLINPVNVDEAGNKITFQDGGRPVWTGSTSSGLVSMGDTCNDWTSDFDSDSGMLGFNFGDDSWFSAESRLCGGGPIPDTGIGRAHIYCIQQSFE
ncbi:MAG: hypothetical protein ACU843_12605 [Gammaproteobacteria bacterium]